MIGKEEMSDLVIEACPSWEPKWKEFTDEWKGEPELPIYLALADFSRHLIAMLERNETEQFPRIFGVIERFHIEGDGFAKEAATIGILESLPNTGLHISTDPEQFRPYLKPDSEKWWNKLYEFWENGKLLTDDQ
jgi:hypothetical protein